MVKVYKREYYCLIPSCEVYEYSGCDYCINNCESLYVRRPIEKLSPNRGFGDIFSEIKDMTLDNKIFMCNEIEKLLDRRK